MNGRNGIVYFHTFGKKLDSYDDLPESMKEVIKSTYPKYDRPPPTDDQRKKNIKPTESFVEEFENYLKKLREISL